MLTKNTHHVAKVLQWTMLIGLGSCLGVKEAHTLGAPFLVDQKNRDGEVLEGGAEGSHTGGAEGSAQDGGAEGSHTGGAEGSTNPIGVRISKEEPLAAPVDARLQEDLLKLRSTSTQELANQLAYRSVTAVGCGNFSAYFYSTLYPRLLVLQERREIGSRVFQNLVWAYSLRRFRMNSATYLAVGEALRILISVRLEPDAPAEPVGESLTRSLGLIPLSLRCGFGSQAPVPEGFQSWSNEVNSSSITPTESKATIDSSKIDFNLVRSLTEDAFASHTGCRRVFTGNAGNYAHSELAYAQTLSASFAQDLCQPVLPKLYEAQSLPLGHNKNDAFFLSHLKRDVQGLNFEDPEARMAATYALLYTHAMRESNGNFNESRDVSAQNTRLSTMETGAFQVSSQTLYGSVQGTKEVFSYFVRNIKAAIEDDIELSNICLLNDMDHSKRNLSRPEHLSHLKHLLGVKDYRKLEILGGGTSAFGTCAQSPTLVSDFVRDHKATALCFIGLQKACPAFAIKYNSLMVRSLRHHYGPFWTHQELRAKGYTHAKYFKPYMQIECLAPFEQILRAKEQVCVRN